MDAAIAILAGVFFVGAFYLILSKSIIRILLGVATLGNATNLLIFVAGRLTAANPPVVPASRDVPAAPFANPLPQALILTAIVIGFALFAFLFVLAFRAYQSLDADNTDHLRLAEPEGSPQPPLDY